MSLPRIASREEWRAARVELLEREKELTKRRDALSVERRELPMVEIDKAYAFHGPQGEVGLLDLFEGRPQLIIYHFMFDPDWDEGCSSCTAGTDEMSPGLLEHLHTRDTTYAMVSRAPLEKLERWKAARGWEIPWYSSFGGDFNYDFGVTIDASVGSGRVQLPHARRVRGPRAAVRRRPAIEMPGQSCFLQVDGACVPHVLPVRAGPRVDRWLLLLPRPHRPRPPGGLGGAEGAERLRSHGHAELRLLTCRSAHALEHEAVASVRPCQNPSGVVRR